MLLEEVFCRTKWTKKYNAILSNLNKFFLRASKREKYLATKILFAVFFSGTHVQLGSVETLSGLKIPYII